MSIEKTREIMARYFASEHDDVSMMAADVVFTIMATGQEHRGPQAVLDMLTALLAFLIARELGLRLPRYLALFEKLRK